MSTKVYEAYRVREGHDPFTVFWKIQREGRNQARKRLLKIFRDVLEGRSHEAHLQNKEQDRLFKAWLKEKYGDAEDGISIFKEYGLWSESACPEELKRTSGVFAVSNEEVFERSKRTCAEGDTPKALDVDAWARSKYAEQVTRYQQDPWALDVSVTVRELQGRYYLIPHCERSSLVRGSLEFMKTMEELEDFAYWNNVDPPDEVPHSEWERRGAVWNHFHDDLGWTNFLALEVVSWLGWSDVSPMMEFLEKRARA